MKSWSKSSKSTVKVRSGLVEKRLSKKLAPGKQMSEAAQMALLKNNYNSTALLFAYVC
jgi:hypothetical protein